MEDENRTIDRMVDFPLRDANPSTLGEVPEGMADITYKLFGTVHHKGRRCSRGHYTAITNKSTANLWHHYNNYRVKAPNFRNRRQNKTRVEYQIDATILFYPRSRPPRCVNIDTTMPISHRVMPHAQDGLLDDDIPQPDITRQAKNDSGKPTSPRPTTGPDDSTQCVINHSGEPIGQRVMPNAQDGILQNDICQLNDVVELLKPSKCNQSPTMARPRPQTRTEMLMPRRHYEAMIRARAAEERNNILWPNSMVLECTEHAVGQSRQAQELHLPMVLNSHANNMAVTSTIPIMDDSILPIPPRVMPHAQDGILRNGIPQINDSTQCIIDHSGEPIAQRVLPNALAYYKMTFVNLLISQ
jgi:hypothetical protein